MTKGEHVCRLREHNNTVIKGHRPSVPRCLKCQYVVTKSIIYMLKKPSEKMANSSAS